MYEDVKAGQIWEMQNGKKVLILVAHEGFANVFYVNDPGTSIGGDFELINGAGVIDPRKMTFTAVRNLQCVIDTVPESELQDIRERFMYAIGERDTLPDTNLRHIMREREGDIWKDVAIRLLNSMGGNR